jgi:hypothetical protein
MPLNPGTAPRTAAPFGACFASWPLPSSQMRGSPPQQKHREHLTPTTRPCQEKNQRNFDYPGNRLHAQERPGPPASPSESRGQGPDAA